MHIRKQADGLYSICLNEENDKGRDYSDKPLKSAFSIEWNSIINQRPSG